MTYSAKITQDYLNKLKAIGLPTKDLPNPSVVLFMYGDGIRASPKFNFQVYGGRKGLTLVTNDKATLDRLLSGEALPDLSGKRIILMDDSGWGFPVGGVLCGAYDEQTRTFHLREVEVEFFQGLRFTNHDYLERFKERAFEIVDEIGPSLDDTVIKICTGYVNTVAKEGLRERGFYLVDVDEIGHPLQTWLEEQNRRYVKNLLRQDLYYDPKTLTKREIARKYGEVMNFARHNNLMYIVKTGWGRLQRQH